MKVFVYAIAYLIFTVLLASLFGKFLKRMKL
jgi:hypothetical protein